MYGTHSVNSWNLQMKKKKKTSDDFEWWGYWLHHYFMTWAATIFVDHATSYGFVNLQEDQTLQSTILAKQKYE